MLDIRFIRQNPDLVKENAQRRNARIDVELVLGLDSQIQLSQRALEEAQRSLNLITKKFAQADLGEKMDLQQQASAFKEVIRVEKAKLADLNSHFQEEMLKIPNLTGPNVPKGNTDEDNVPIRFVGKPPEVNFPLKDHLEIGAEHSLIDFESGSKVTGSKFYFLKNEAVLLELGLINLAIALAVKHGFTPVTTPELARDEIIMASGFTPRGPESQIYSLSEGGLSLIGTSEIAIGGMLKDTVLQPRELPVKICGVSHCFRTEAGSYGKEARGLYRVHQFSKVELYQFDHPQHSAEALEDILAIEEEYYQALELPYRVMSMCEGDLSAPAYKKYDIEAWMPFLGGYGEVTSVSNCTDFQARRLNIRYKDHTGNGTKFVHTLNGTAVATTRTLLAILENNQQADGSIRIPKALAEITGVHRIESK